MVLGVGGGIAAYKVAHLLRLLTESGHAVRVVPTRAALEFVGAATWAALSGQAGAVRQFRRIHATALLLNLVQLVVAVCGLIVLSRDLSN